MSLPVLRTADGWWLQRPDGAVRVRTDAATTGQLLAQRDAVMAARGSEEAPVAVAGLRLLSPVTTPCRVVAQMANYASHAREANLNPRTLPLTFFTKSDGSVCGPEDEIIRPAHVNLLDYEVEIGLVVGRQVPVGSTVGAADLPGIVGALVLTNDVSARDVQLPQTQFYEAKSYPTFTPVGPALVLLEPGELGRLPQLRLRTWVNGELRQDELAADMIYTPLQAFQSLSRFQHLDPGDLVLTGTPAGTALSAPPKPVEIIGSLLPTATKWRIFFRRQARNPRYLRDGDLVETAITTDDGGLDLGRQCQKVVSGP